MNPFTQMATTLTAHAVSPWAIQEAMPEKGLSRTERIRRLLAAATRPVTAAEIAFDMDTEFPNFGAHLVWLLMKYDISKGRVLLRNGRYSYNHDYDTAEASAIRAAENLLKRNGYQIKPPKGKV